MVQSFSYSIHRTYLDPEKAQKNLHYDLITGTRVVFYSWGPNLLVKNDGLTGIATLTRPDDHRSYAIHPSLPWVFYEDEGTDSKLRSQPQVLVAGDTVLGAVCNVVVFAGKAEEMRLSWPTAKWATMEAALSTDSLSSSQLSLLMAKYMPLRMVKSQLRSRIKDEWIAQALAPVAAALDTAQFNRPAVAYLTPGPNMLDNYPSDREIRKFLLFMMRNTSYPKETRRQGIEGTVVMEFMVNEDSRISDIRTLQSVDPFCDAEAMRVLASFGRWAPRTYHKQPAKCLFTIPITFRLQ